LTVAGREGFSNPRWMDGKLLISSLKMVYLIFHEFKVYCTPMDSQLTLVKEK